MSDGRKDTRYTGGFATRHPFLMVLLWVQVPVLAVVTLLLGEPTQDVGLTALGLLSFVLLLTTGWRVLAPARTSTDVSGDRYRMSFEEAPIGMAVLKPSGDFLQVNRAMAGILDYDESQLVGTNVTALVHGDDQTELGEAWEEMGNSSSHTATEWMRWLTGRGRPIWSRASLSLVPWRPDQPAMVILQIEDVTHTHEEQRRLEDLLRGKDQFVAAVGDEIRKPLGLLIDLTDIANHPHIDTGDTLPRIEAHAKEIASIVDDLVVSARADTTPAPVVAHHLDAETLCRDVLSGVPGTEDVSLDFRATEMWADPALTRQIVNSLLINAIRYGGPEVALRIVSSGPDTVIEVRDNGPEIPAEDRDRVFSGDLRNGQPVTRPAAVGLSLTVGRHLARQMDGDIEYRRTSDGENVFELRLPSEQLSEIPKPRAVGIPA